MVSEKYVELIQKLAETHHFGELRAVDLGCGDMRIGSHISALFQSYLGADIVESLIQHHCSQSFAGEVSFQKINIIEDELPDGDVCFIRQVLQHLSNQQILEILPKLEKYRFVLITEHLPSTETGVEKNLDKSHGGDIRLYKNSGVYLDSPPFQLKGNYEEVLAVNDSSLQNIEDSGVIKTFLYCPKGN